MDPQAVALTYDTTGTPRTVQLRRTPSGCALIVPGPLPALIYACFALGLVFGVGSLLYAVLFAVLTVAYGGQVSTPKAVGAIAFFGAGGALLAAMSAAGLWHQWRGHPRPRQICLDGGRLSVTWLGSTGLRDRTWLLTDLQSVTLTHGRTQFARLVIVPKNGRAWRHTFAPAKDAQPVQEFSELLRQALTAGRNA